MRPRREISRQPDFLKQITEALTLLNEKLAQQFDNLKTKGFLVKENNDFRAGPVHLLQAYAIEENNAKRADVKITQVFTFRADISRSSRSS